jgi:type VI secretion system protein ImpF
MATAELERTVRPSVLDRLIDLDPRTPADPPLSFSESVRRYKAAVLRDLEWLLNTRQIPEEVPARCPEVQNSVYMYGLPDTTSMSGDDPAVRRKLQQKVEECIRKFEPRLSAPEVALAVAASGANPRLVHFMVQAILRMDPDPERIVFDTMLDGATGAIRVEGQTNA